MYIVWRNPAAVSAIKPQIEWLAADDYGAVYAVRIHDETKAFELILRRRTQQATDLMLRTCCCES
jgi:hypothetical protein